MYGIDRKRSFAGSLRKVAGCAPEEIDLVINTHLHFDHAGGNTVHGTERHASVAQFKNARYLASKSEFEHACKPHERDRASYLSENWAPLLATGQLQLMPDSYEPFPGLIVQQVRGHSDTMQTIKLTRGGQTLYGFFDMVPTRHHLPLPWIMSYDLYPTETLEYKKRILPVAVKENWICHFYHDVEMPLCRLEETDGKIRPVEI